MTQPMPTPWDVLTRGRPIRLTPMPEPEPERELDAGDAAMHARAGTKTAALLAELACVDSATTLSLSVRCDLTDRQIWGLLKQARQSGQVSFYETATGQPGRWCLNRDWQGRDIERAAALLRAAGWVVERGDA